MKKRLLVLIMILVILLCGSGYYFFYFTPSSLQIAALESSISQKSEDIEFASQQALIWGSLSNERKKIADDCAVLANDVPEEFDNADVLTRIQKIIIPHTKDVVIKFPASGTQQEATAVHTVEISFIVSYDTLQAILKAFADENIANRIVILNYTRTEANINAETDSEKETESPLAVNMSVDFLTRPRILP